MLKSAALRDDGLMIIFTSSGTRVLAHRPCQEVILWHLTELAYMQLDEPHLIYALLRYVPAPCVYLERLSHSYSWQQSAP